MDPLIDGYCRRPAGSVAIFRITDATASYATEIVIRIIGDDRVTIGILEGRGLRSLRIANKSLM
jgi:hypothetical protein